MGAREQQAKQEEIWITRTELASGPGHPLTGHDPAFSTVLPGADSQHLAQL